jgi:hypothetical protein
MFSYTFFSITNTQSNEDSPIYNYLGSVKSEFRLIELTPSKFLYKYYNGSVLLDYKYWVALSGINQKIFDKNITLSDYSYSSYINDKNPKAYSNGKNLLCIWRYDYLYRPTTLPTGYYNAYIKYNDKFISYLSRNNLIYSNSYVNFIECK